MKKIILITACVFAYCLSIAAQRKVETFEHNAFNWEEVIEKNKSAFIQNDYLKLYTKKENMVSTITRFPVDVHYNFKITATIIVPHLNDNMSFGFIYDWLSDANFSTILFETDKYTLYNNMGIVTKGNGKLQKAFGLKKYRLTNDTKIVNHSTIKLPKGKNRTVTLVMEKYGNKLFFRVNNVLVCETKQDLHSSYCGFLLVSTKQKQQVKIMDVVIEQILEDE